MTAASAHRLDARRLPVPCTIETVEAMPLPGLGRLIRDSKEDGHAFLQRLQDDWEKGTNRFDQPGEVLYGAYMSGTLVGLCGRNIDPYANDRRRGRLRHLYVHRDVRRRQVASTLLRAVLDGAASHFDLLTLRTQSPAADAFYRRHGFAATRAFESSTHVIWLAG